MTIYYARRNTTKEKISGGDLARQAYPAKVVTLVMSDVSAEPSEQLGGGPCVYDPKDRRALAVLAKYELVDKVSHSVRELLGDLNPRISAADGRLDERKRYRFVQQCVLACNDDAVEGMMTQSLKLGLSPMRLTLTGAGTIDEIAEEYAKIASLMILATEGKITKLDMYEQMKESPVCSFTDQQVWEMLPAGDKWGLGLCLVLGGRPAVHLNVRPGKGGPNQELALRFALYWYTRTRQYPILRGYTVWFAGGSSRGKDGNTGAAGAFGYRSLATDIQLEYKKACDVHRAALFKWRRLAVGKQDESEIAVRNEEAVHVQQYTCLTFFIARAQSTVKTRGKTKGRDTQSSRWKVREFHGKENAGVLVRKRGFARHLPREDTSQNISQDASAKRA